jgi:hypothetical protein
MGYASAVVLVALIGMLPGPEPAMADERVPYTIKVENAAAKVGEKSAVVATITPPEGFNITKSYRARVIDLSAYQDRGVAFDDEVVFGTIENGSVVFEVGVTPTEPGEHPINGLIRVSFYTEGRSESKSVPLMATVMGTE